MKLILSVAMTCLSISAYATVGVENSITKAVHTTNNSNSKIVDTMTLTMTCLEENGYKRCHMYEVKKKTKSERYDPKGETTPEVTNTEESFIMLGNKFSALKEVFVKRLNVKEFVDYTELTMAVIVMGTWGLMPPLLLLTPVAVVGDLVISPYKAIKSKIRKRRAKRNKKRILAKLVKVSEGEEVTTPVKWKKQDNLKSVFHYGKQLRIKLLH